jgi:hypothetical protein
MRLICSVNNKGDKMEAYNFLRKKYSIPPKKSLNEFSTPTFACWGSLVKLLEEYSGQIEPQPKEFIECYIGKESGFDIRIDDSIPKNEIHLIDEDGNEVLKVVNVAV